MEDYDEEYRHELFKEDGRREGRVDGREEGSTLKLTTLICRKINKGKSISEISEELDEDVSVVEPIFTIADRFAPDYDTEKIYVELKKEAIS